MARAVFTYGTLAFPAVMQAVTGRAFASQRAWLTGFERFAVRGAVYPGVLETGCRSTDGRLYLEVDEDTLGRLDRFEDWLYERHTHEVTVLGGEPRPAEVWVVPPWYAPLLTRGPWDPRRFQRRELARYLRMCRAFRREDRAGAKGA